MQMLDIGDNIRLHYDHRGPDKGPAVILSHPLGTDFRIWDRLVARLASEWRVIRYDMRGHGLSTCPEGPYFMGDLVADAAQLIERLEVPRAVFVGLSIGGMIGQGLAAERPDLVQALVMSNTAVKIGTPQTWAARMEAVRRDGLEAVAFATMERWFSRAWRRAHPGEVEGWMNLLLRTPREGWLGAAAAVAETDLYESTARLTLPVLGIAGSEDGSTPPDLVRESVELVRGARFELIRGVGHLPPVEAPGRYAALLGAFVAEAGPG